MEKLTFGYACACKQSNYVRIELLYNYSHESVFYASVSPDLAEKLYYMEDYKLRVELIWDIIWGLHYAEINEWITNIEMGVE